MKPKSFPPVENYRFERARLFFPETPGVIVRRFRVAVNDQNLFVAQTAFIQVKSERQPGQAAARNDVIERVSRHAFKIGTKSGRCSNLFFDRFRQSRFFRQTAVGAAFGFPPQLAAGGRNGRGGRFAVGRFFVFNVFLIARRRRVRVEFDRRRVALDRAGKRRLVAVFDLRFAADVIDDAVSSADGFALLFDEDAQLRGAVALFIVRRGFPVTGKIRLGGGRGGRNDRVRRFGGVGIGLVRGRVGRAGGAAGQQCGAETNRQK